MAKKHPKKRLNKAFPRKPQLIAGIKRHILSPLKIFLSALGVLSTVVVFWPRISVEPSALFDIKNPLESSFQIKNDGYLFCYNIHASLFVKKVDFGFGIMDNIVVNNFDSDIPCLSPNDISTISLQKKILKTNMPVETAEIYIDISYKPRWLPFFFFKDTYRFKSAKTLNGYMWQRFFRDR